MDQPEYRYPYALEVSFALVPDCALAHFVTVTLVGFWLALSALDRTCPGTGSVSLNQSSTPIAHPKRCELAQYPRQKHGGALSIRG